MVNYINKVSRRLRRRTNILQFSINGHKYGFPNKIVNSRNWLFVLRFLKGSIPGWVKFYAQELIRNPELHVEYCIFNSLIRSTERVNMVYFVFYLELEDLFRENKIKSFLNACGYKISPFFKTEIFTVFPRPVSWGSDFCIKSIKSFSFKKNWFSDTYEWGSPRYFSFVSVPDKTILRISEPFYNTYPISLPVEKKGSLGLSNDINFDENSLTPSFFDIKKKVDAKLDSFNIFELFDFLIGFSSVSSGRKSVRKQISEVIGFYVYYYHKKVLNKDLGWRLRFISACYEQEVVQNRFSSSSIFSEWLGKVITSDSCLEKEYFNKNKKILDTAKGFSNPILDCCHALEVLLGNSSNLHKSNLKKGKTRKVLKYLQNQSKGQK